MGVDTLTLARYLLESSLLDYAYVTERDSRLASACLLLAMRLANTGAWVSVKTCRYHAAGEVLVCNISYSELSSGVIV